MKAFLIRQHGDLDQVRYEEIDDPQIKAFSVRVKIQASALNHLDLWVVRGLPGRELQMPHVLGSDGAGIVEEIGEGVSRFSVGDRVMINAVLSCGECEFCNQDEHSLCIRLCLLGEQVSGTCSPALVFSEPHTSLTSEPSAAAHRCLHRRPTFPGCSPV